MAQKPDRKKKGPVFNKQVDFKNRISHPGLPFDKTGQLNITASVLNSLPTAGSAILTDEIIKGVRKELIAAIIRADNWAALSFKKLILPNHFIFEQLSAFHPGCAKVKVKDPPWRDPPTSRCPRPKLSPQYLGSIRISQNNISVNKLYL
jgi:hypothetical protein